MLYIVHKFNRETEWHVGDGEPEDVDIHQVSEVRADGDELEYIRLHFPGLVIPTNRVVCWFGEMAKFITANL